MLQTWAILRPKAAVTGCSLIVANSAVIASFCMSKQHKKKGKTQPTEMSYPKAEQNVQAQGKRKGKHSRIRMHTIMNSVTTSPTRPTFPPFFSTISRYVQDESSDPTWEGCSLYHQRQ